MGQFSGSRPFDSHHLSNTAHLQAYRRLIDGARASINVSITRRDNYPWFTGSCKPSTCEVSIIRVWGAKPSRLPEEVPSRLSGIIHRRAVSISSRSGNQCLFGQYGAINYTDDFSSLILCSTCSKIFSGGNAYIQAFGHGIVSASRLGEIVTGRRTEGYACSPPSQTGQTPNRSQISLIVLGFSLHSL